MSLVRQMPELYLRGSMANITMANMTSEAKEHVSGLVEFIAEHPKMQGHRQQMMREFGVTIKSDYNDDYMAADEEYKIAIWRGVVDLYYHHNYTFKCRACQSGYYTTKRGRPKQIDRVMIPCPNCDMVEITKQGDTSLTVGSFVTNREFLDSFADFPTGSNVPECRSTIDYIAGDKKYDNPDAILNDPDQLRKFFGEYVWNYFRQQINENKRQEYYRTPQLICDRADFVITQEIISACHRTHTDYYYCNRTQPEFGKYNIRIQTMLVPPEFIAEYSLVLNKAKLYGIKVETTASDILVYCDSDAPTIESYIIKPEYISILDSKPSSENEESEFSVQQVSHKTVRGSRMDFDSHTQAVESLDVLEIIRDALPEGHCRAVFDLSAQVGEIYDKFSSEYGDGLPRISYMAQFLGVTPKVIKTHQDTIKVICVANGLMPDDN